MFRNSTQYQRCHQLKLFVLLGLEVFDVFEIRQQNPKSAYNSSTKSSGTAEHPEHFFKTFLNLGHLGDIRENYF